MLSHGQVLAVLEELAPRAGAEPGDEPCYEIMNGDNCNRLAICAEPTERHLYLAASDGADFVITHHAWHGEGEDMVRSKGISIYRLHSAWDLAPDGNAATLARMMGLTDLLLNDGCFTGLTGLSLRALIERCQRIIGRSVLPYYGDLSVAVRAVGIIPGSGFMSVFRRHWESLKINGCDTIVSGDLSHTALRYAQEEGLNLIDLGHSGMAKPGLAHLAYLLRCRLLALGCEVDFYDEILMASHYTAWSLPRQEEGAQEDAPQGAVVLPFPR